MLKCSVVIPTYNRERLLRHTLESLARQRLPRDEFEVIVVDDGSADQTSSMVAGFSERLNLRYHYREDEGFRAAAARNLGITAARSDICVFVDSGVVVHSGCLTEHLAAHQAVAGPAAVVGYVYCLMLDNDHEAARTIGETIDFDDADRSIELLRSQRLWPDIRDEFYAKYGEDFGDLPAPWVVYWTCNASAATAQLRRVGMFDEEFKGWGGEDLDLGYRLFRAGAHFLANRRASAIHLPHDKAVKQVTEGDNYAYIAKKYANPITDLVPSFATLEITPFSLNDVIRERGLAEYAARGARGTAA